jgi:uncharacterized membrane protein (UPF0182 family)
MGYLAVDSNAGNKTGVKSSEYGRLRMLEISAETTVPGPGQVQNTFNSDPVISAQINILKQGQSEVLNGNLLTLPVGGGLLYVQPVFVQASSGTQLPALQKVLVAFGDNIAFEPTLDEALDVLFGGESGATAGDEGVEPGPGATPTPTPTEPGEQPTEPTEPTDEYQAALQDAKQAMLDRDAALKAGDLTAFAEADDRLTAAVEKLIALGEQP